MSFPVRIPVQLSVLSANNTITSFVFLAVMAGDCGDEILSKSKPQSAGVLSSAISEILLDLRCFSFNFIFEMFTPVRSFHTFSAIFENFLNVR